MNGRQLFARLRRTLGVNRRALLAVTAAATSCAIGGCLDGGSTDGTPTATAGGDGQAAPTPTGGTSTDGPDGGSGTEEPDDPQTPTDRSDDQGTPTRTASGEPELVDQEIDIQEVECGGSGENYYEVDVDDGVVTVDGSIGGNNACYSARVDAAEYDADEDRFDLVVRSFEDRDDDEACTDCIVDVYYRATFTFEGGEPGEVKVEHVGYSDS